MKDLGIKSPSDYLPQVAFQPAARGGVRHFTAGNIRIVKKARELLLDQDHREWTEEEWISFLEEGFGMLKNDRGNMEREQLVVGCQSIYLCAICDGNQYV
jgi:hypothetical protein